MTISACGELVWCLEHVCIKYNKFCVAEDYIALLLQCIQPYLSIIPEPSWSSLYIRRVQPTRCNVSQFIYFRRTLCMFQMVFLSIIRSSKLHIQHQVFVRPILLPAASLARLAAGSSIGLTNTWCCMCNFELLMMDRKTIWNMQSVLRK